MNLFQSSRTAGRVEFHASLPRRSILFSSIDLSPFFAKLSAVSPYTSMLRSILFRKNGAHKKLNVYTDYKSSQRALRAGKIVLTINICETWLFSRTSSHFPSFDANKRSGLHAGGRCRGRASVGIDCRLISSDRGAEIWRHINSARLTRVLSLMHIFPSISSRIWPTFAALPSLPLYTSQVLEK